MNPPGKLSLKFCARFHDYKICRWEVIAGDLTSVLFGSLLVIFSHFSPHCRWNNQNFKTTITKNLLESTDSDFRTKILIIEGFVGYILLATFNMSFWTIFWSFYNCSGGWWNQNFPEILKNHSRKVEFTAVY